MCARKRTEDKRYVQIGSMTQATSGDERVFQSTLGEHNVCEDTIGNWPNDNDLLITKQSIKGATIGGTYPATGSYQWTFDNVPLPENWVVNYPFPSGFLPPWNTSLVAKYMTTALARTNRQSEDVNLPAFLGELSDVPGMVKELDAAAKYFRNNSWMLKAETIKWIPDYVRRNGEIYLSRVAKGNLAWRFAIAPTIGDVAKLFKFAESANQRFTHLQKVRDHGHASENVQLAGDTTTTFKENQTLSTRTGVVIKGSISTTFSYKDWASAKWEAAPGTKLPPTVKGLDSLARRANLGITSGGLLRAAWELTPWSWLVDYFTNIGEYLQASDNSLGLIPGSMCLMRKTNVITYEKPTSLPANLTCSGEVIKRYEQKKRFVIPSPVAIPYASMPALRAGQLSILGSLFAVRAIKTARPAANMNSYWRRQAMK